MMSLTGVPLLVLLAVVTAVVFGGTVWLWPRFARRGWRPLLGRVGLVAAVQLTLVMTVAAVANSYFDFYDNWSQLFGIGGGSSTAAYAGSYDAGGPLVVRRVMAVGVPGGGNPARAGQVQQVTITGGRSGLSDAAYVYLPPQYFQPAYRDARFPAVIVSTGYPGNVTALVTRLRYPVRMTTGINTGQIRPMVLVMVSPMVVQGRDTECVDVPGGPQAATYWAQDIPSAVASRYRVATSGQGWGLMGDSTGGYCALKLAMSYPDRFHAAVSLSGYFSALKDWTTGNLYASSPAFRQQNDLLWRLRHLPPPPVSLMLTSSRAGESDYVSTMRFAKLARAPLYVSTLVRQQGGHNFQTWSSELPEGLRWLSRHLSPITSSS